MNVTELGWVKQITHPNSLSETFSHDALGNVTNHVDAAGRSTFFTYAPTRKLTSVRRPLSSGATLTNSTAYDEQFNTLNITDAKNRLVEAYQIDIQDRPVSVTNLEGQVMSITYGLGDFVKSMTRFDGTVVSNSYNSDGFLSSVAYPDSTIQLSYLKNGPLKTAANEQGTISNTWNMANRLTSVSLTSVL